MPGPNIVRITVCVEFAAEGAGWRGRRRLGFHSDTLTIGLSLGGLYFSMLTSLFFSISSVGLSAAAAGTLIATGIKLLVAHRPPLGRGFSPGSPLPESLSSSPLMVVLLGLVPLSIVAVRVERAPW
jgi:hypothetical protein